MSFEREKIILQAIFTERAPLLKRIIARLIGFDGAYHRFTGKVTIERFDGDVRVERVGATRPTSGGSLFPSLPKERRFASGHSRCWANSTAS